MTTPHKLLAAIPDELLRRTTTDDAKRQRRLVAWLDRRSFHPPLAELDEERARRGHPQHPAHPATGNPEGEA